MTINNQNNPPNTTNSAKISSSKKGKKGIQGKKSAKNYANVAQSPFIPRKRTHEPTLERTLPAQTPIFPQQSTAELAEIADLWAEEDIKKVDISKPTLNRHISRLIKLKRLITIKAEDFRKYGLTETDKKARFLTLARNDSLPKYYNLVLSSLKSEDPTMKKNALIELESMNSISLLPSQLTNLVSNLLKDNYEIGERIIRVIYNNFQKGIVPSNLTKLQNNLILFYEKHKEKVNNEIKKNIMFMLGVLGIKKIVDFLKEDILKNKTFDTLQHEGYIGWFVAKVIDDAKAELFDFQNKLKDDKMIQITFQIRDEARRNLTLRSMGYQGTIYEQGMRLYRTKIRGIQ